MSDFNQDNRSGGRRGGQRFRGRDFKRGGFGGRDSVRTMHKAICAECGSECEVPFEPSGDRPVYCSKCFEKEAEKMVILKDQTGETLEGQGLKKDDLHHLPLAVLETQEFN